MLHDVVPLPTAFVAWVHPPSSAHHITFRPNHFINCDIDFEILSRYRNCLWLVRWFLLVCLRISFPPSTHLPIDSTEQFQFEFYVDTRKGLLLNSFGACCVCSRTWSVMADEALHSSTIHQTKWKTLSEIAFTAQNSPSPQRTLNEKLKYCRSNQLAGLQWRLFPIPLRNVVS